MREFSRVIDNGELRKLGREKWMDWAPRIMALADKDNSTAIKNLLESYSEEDESDGKYPVTHCYFIV